MILTYVCLNIFRDEYCENWEEVNDDEEWFDDFDEVVGKVPIARFKISNAAKAKMLLSDESMNSLLVGARCLKGRKSIPCPNDCECAESFGSVKISRDIIREFRKTFWSISKTEGQVKERRKTLLDNLFAMRVLDKETNKFHIQYKIDGIVVCKLFFYVS